MEYVITEEEFNQIERAHAQLRLFADMVGQGGNTLVQVRTDDLNSFLAVQEEVIGAALRTVTERQVRQRADNHAALAEGQTPPVLAQAKPIGRTAWEAIEIGRELLALKKRCGHGAFLSHLDAIGLDGSRCQRFMQVATRRDALTSELIEAAGSPSKLFELMVLDDADLLALGRDGGCEGLTLQGVAEMGVKRLRKAIRDLQPSGANIKAPPKCRDIATFQDAV